MLPLAAYNMTSRQLIYAMRYLPPMMPFHGCRRASRDAMLLLIFFASARAAIAPHKRIIYCQMPYALSAADKMLLHAAADACVTPCRFITPAG